MKTQPASKKEERTRKKASTRSPAVAASAVARKNAKSGRAAATATRGRRRRRRRRSAAHHHFLWSPRVVNSLPCPRRKGRKTFHGGGAPCLHHEMVAPRENENLTCSAAIFAPNMTPTIMVVSCNHKNGPSLLCIKSIAVSADVVHQMGNEGIDG